MDGSSSPDIGMVHEMTAVEVVRNFSEVQLTAMRVGPVVITRHGKPAVALVSYESWRDTKRQAQQKLTTVLDELEDAYLSLDRDWRITTLNRPAELYFGIPRDAVVGVELGTAFPAIVGTEAEDRLRRAMEQGEGISFPWKSVLHSKRSISVRAFPLHRDEGGIGVLFRSLPEEQSLKAELDVERKRLQTLMGVMGDRVVIDVDRHGIVLEWSPAAEGLFGWSAAEAVGRSVELIYSDAAREAGVIWKEFSFAHRQGRAEMLTVHVSKTGTEVPCKDLLVPIHDGEGRFLKIIEPRGNAR